MKPSEPIIMTNPCPMTLKRVTQGKEKFHCSSCHKTLVDFSAMSLSDVKAYLSANKNTCGIFTSQQVYVPAKSHWYQVRYGFLTAVAFLGFNVKPIQAQTISLIKNDTTKSIAQNKKACTAKEKTKKETKSKRRRMSIRNQLAYRKMGCPDF